MDTLVESRGHAGAATETSGRLLGQLIGELDNLDELSGVRVLATTSRLDRVDPALLGAGRLEYVIDFPLPDENERHAILTVHTATLPLADDVDLHEIAAQTQGFSGGQLAQVWPTRRDGRSSKQSSPRIEARKRVSQPFESRRRNFTLPLTGSACIAWRVSETRKRVDRYRDSSP